MSHTNLGLLARRRGLMPIGLVRGAASDSRPDPEAILNKLVGSYPDFLVSHDNDTLTWKTVR